MKKYKQITDFLDLQFGTKLWKVITKSVHISLINKVDLEEESTSDLYYSLSKDLKRRVIINFTDNKL